MGWLENEILQIAPLALAVTSSFAGLCTQSTDNDMFFSPLETVFTNPIKDFEHCHPVTETLCKS